jgi:hypothetical protein
MLKPPASNGTFRCGPDVTQALEQRFAKGNTPGVLTSLLFAGFQDLPGISANLIYHLP